PPARNAWSPLSSHPTGEAPAVLFKVTQASDDPPPPRQSQLLAEVRPGMTAANKPECRHTRRRGGSHTSRRILDHDAVGGLNTHPRRCVREQIGCGLAVADVACGK